jgi:hypothetical protein
MTSITGAFNKIQSVIQPFVAFYETDVAAVGIIVKGFLDFIGLHGVEVQVVTIATGGFGKPHGINIVGAFFKRAYLEILRS